MSIFHLTVKRGSRSKNRLAVDKHDYIVRLGRFAQRHDGELAHSESGNMPAWAQADTRLFWVGADDQERANATLYHEVEFALPVELSPAQQIKCVREFVRQICGEKHPYSWGLHAKENNPHVHLMFSGRMLDGIERDAEQFFKRYNAKNPERGGCRKEASGDARGREWVKQIRTDWQDVANRYLAAAGQDARIDHRSHKDRELEAAPGVHLGRKAHRLEKSGRKTVRGLRNQERTSLNTSLSKIRSSINHQQGVTMDQIEITNATDPYETPEVTQSNVALRRAWEQRRKQLNLAVRTREDGRIDYMLSFTKAGKKIDYVACKFDGKDRIVAQGNHSDSRAAAIAQAVLDRGWTKVNLTGSLEHQVAVARLLRQAGIEINEMSAEARAELERLDAEASGKSAENAVVQAKPEQTATTEAPPLELNERDKLALRWLKTDAPVNAIEAAKLRKEPERLRQMFETHPEARRWELIQQQKAAGVPAALHGFQIDQDAKPQNLVGTVRHVGEQIWVQPQDSPNVVVPLPITANPPKPGQRISVSGGEITRDHDNTLQPR